MIPSSQSVLLDTNVLVHLARNDPTGRWIEEHFSLSSREERPFVSTITEGEILGFARFRDWGESRREILRQLLAGLVRVDAGLPDIVNAYADLSVLDLRGGRNTSDNDLWIAATAIATNATLLTRDHDFDWMHPALISVHLIDLVS